MRYVMKQKLFSFGSRFAIRDENGQDAFFVQGEIFTLGHKLSFQDTGGRELLYIQQKLLSLEKTYELYRGDEHAGTIRKDLFTIFRCTFEIHIDGHGDLEATGNLTDHEYEIARNGRPVAQISKQWFTWADTYGVDIAEGEDPVLILASTVVIDMCCHHR